MAEVRRLKTGRWRLYNTPDLYPIKDPQTGALVSFETLAEARRWWRRRYPGAEPPEEAIKCSKCGAYFGRGATRTLSGGLYYHLSHSPKGLRR